MPTTCDITFDNPNRVYNAGELLSGNVRLTLTKEKKVRGVYIKIFGRAYAYWTEYCSIDHNRNRNRERGQHSSGHHVSYTGEEDYLDEKTYFVGGNSGEIRLQPGTQNYTFQCLLPAGLPTSVEHEVGHITYGARVVLDIPMWPDKEFKEHFTVIKPINLNVDPSFRMPATNQKSKVFLPLGFCCCFPSDPLNVDVRTPVRGYAPGQTINVKLNVGNESEEDVINFSVELIKEITFRGSGVHDGRYESREKSVNHTITGAEVDGCKAGQKASFNVNIRVPAIPPTDFTTSSVVRVNYKIRITGPITGCCRSDFMLDLPITIGTYPIEDFNIAPNVNSNAQTVIPNQPSAPQLPMGMPITNAPTISMPPLPNGLGLLPISTVPTASTAPSAPSEEPPTYEEAMRLAEGNSNNFTPKYPMFRRQTSYSIDNN